MILYNYALDELHEYLEQKYANIVVEYNKAIEKDIINIKDDSSRISREIEGNQQYHRGLQKLQSNL